MSKPGAIDDTSPEAEAVLIGLPMRLRPVTGLLGNVKTRSGVIIQSCQSAKLVCDLSQSTTVKTWPINCVLISTAGD